MYTVNQPIRDYINHININLYTIKECITSLVIRKGRVVKVGRGRECEWGQGKKLGRCMESGNRKGRFTK